MRFVINMTCDNEAFQPDPALEVARVLREVAARLEAGDDFGFYTTLFDANGNDVGRAKLAERL